METTIIDSIIALLHNRTNLEHNNITITIHRAMAAPKPETKIIQKANSQKETYIRGDRGYKYDYIREKKQEMVWRCEARHCNAKLITKMNKEFVRCEGIHNTKLNPHKKMDTENVDYEFLMERMMWENENRKLNQSSSDIFHRVCRENPSKAYAAESFGKSAERRFRHRRTKKRKPLPGSFEKFESEVENDPLARCNFWKRKQREAAKRIAEQSMFYIRIFAL